MRIEGHSGIECLMLSSQYYRVRTLRVMDKEKVLNNIYKGTSVAKERTHTHTNVHISIKTVGVLNRKKTLR